VRLISSSTLIVVILVILAALAPVHADQLEDGKIAANQGNYAEAVRLWKPLAVQGLPAAQYYLGVMYAHGVGVPEDDAEAVKWYRKAADQGHAKAQTNLGLMYADGEGVPEDTVQAYMWINIAAVQGDDRTIKIKEIVFKKMTPSQIEKAQSLSREWWEKHNQ